MISNNLVNNNCFAAGYWPFGNSCKRI